MTNRGENITTNSRGVYLMTWKNPRPEEAIESIDVVSAETAVPVVLAITGLR